MSQTNCKPQLLQAYLQETISASEETRFLEHLDDCDRCRNALEHSAAEIVTWNEVQRFLVSDEFDPAEESFATCELGAAKPVSEAQINSVLSVLSPTDDPQMLGRLGVYEIMGVVGAGGMGVVLKGHDRSLDRIVAIKVLAPHLASSGAAKARFAREAKAAAAVLHPNVMAIHCVVPDAVLPYLVMPYLNGQSLQKRIDSVGPHDPRAVLRVAGQIGAGLTAAHAQGLVHRDIKPANIMLAEGLEQVAITDFGLARAVDDATMTRSGIIAGTPQYMSPEQAKGDPIDARSDLFSLGSLMYAMCTGHPPFRAETTFGVLNRISEAEPRSLGSTNAEIPTWLENLVFLLLEKRPENRIQQAIEVEQLCHECLVHLEQPEIHPVPYRLRHTRPSKRKHQNLIVAGCLIAAIVVGWTSQSALSPTNFWSRTGPDEENQQSVLGSAPVLGNQSRVFDSEDLAGTVPPAPSGPSAETASLTDSFVHGSEDSLWDDGIRREIDQLNESIQQLEHDWANY